MKLNVWTALLVAASAIVLVDRLQEPLAPAAQACAAVLKAVAAESEADARSLLAALELSNSTAVGSLLLHAQPALLPAVSALRSARSAAAVLPGLSPALALVRSLQLSPAALAALSLVVAIAFVAVFSAAYAVFFSRVSLSAEFANAVSRKQPPAAFPTGWFAVSSSADLKKKDVRPVVLGGQHLVLFRGEDGKAAVLDAYCPHLGAHLAVGGLVSGNTVVCPFHGWAFRGNDGVCTHIPYCDNVPTYTKTNAWPVAERDGLILVWHDVDGQKPLWEPAASGASSSLAVTHGHAELTVAASIQELREGLVCLTSPQRVLVSNWLPGLTAQFSSSWTAPADAAAAASGVSHLTVRQSCSWFGVPVPLLNVTYTGTFAGPGVLSARASTWAGPVWLVDAVTPVQSLQQKHFALAAAHVPVPRFVAKFVLLSWVALQAHLALQWTRQSRASVQPVRAGSDEAASTVTAFREWMGSFAPKSGKKKKEGLDWWSDKLFN